MAKVLQPTTDRQLGRPGQGGARQGCRLDAPYLSFALVFAIAGVIWVFLPIPLRSDILAVCWPILGVITVLQTAWMIIRPWALPRFQA